MHAYRGRLAPPTPDRPLYIHASRTSLCTQDSAGSRVTSLLVCLLMSLLCACASLARFVHASWSRSPQLSAHSRPCASLLSAGGWCTVLAPALGLPASWSALSLVCYMLVVAVLRHPVAVSIAWSGLQLVAHGGMPRDLDSLVAEVKTLLCLLVALHCFEDLLERLGRC